MITNNRIRSRTWRAAQLLRLVAHSSLGISGLCSPFDAMLRDQSGDIRVDLAT